jgi:hypothetical protein
MLFLRPSIANVLFRPTSAILAALQTTQQNNNPYPSWQHCRQHNRTIILTNNYIKLCVCVRACACARVNKDNKGLGEAEITSDDDDDDYDND